MKQDKPSGETTQEKPAVNANRLERLAKVAADASQTKQWQARKNGMQDMGEPSEVRNLNGDLDARAQAEAAMQRMMAKPRGKQRGR